MENDETASIPLNQKPAWDDGLWNTIRESANRCPQGRKLLPFFSWVLLSDGRVAQAPVEVRSYLQAMEAAHDHFHDRLEKADRRIEPIFDEKQGRIVAGEIFCTIPPNTIGFDVCRYLFSVPSGEKVDLEDIHKAIEGDCGGIGLTRQEAKKIYNAVQWVNRRIEKAFEVQSFFAYRGRQVWVQI